jgi:hypothetical protein
MFVLTLSKIAADKYGRRLYRKWAKIKESTHRRKGAKKRYKWDVGN